MMDTLPLVLSVARAVSGLSSNSETVGRLAYEVYEKLFSTLQASKKERGKVISLEEASPVKSQREKLISELMSLQNEIMITISEPKFLSRILLMIIEQVPALNNAKTEQELSVIKLNLGQIRGYLTKYKNLLERRSQARWAAIVVSLIVVLGIITLMVWSTYNGPNINSIVPLLNIPLPVLLWSTIGSFTAILYRFNSSGDIELQDPLRWLFTRPLTGIVMGMITYYVFYLGLLTVSEVPEESLKSSIIFWLIAFLSSFSDRFVDGLLRSLVGKFGGDPNSQLVSLDSVPIENTAVFRNFVDNLPIIGSQSRANKPPKRKSKPKGTTNHENGKAK